jgi:hypothetical protein
LKSTRSVAAIDVESYLPYRKEVLRGDAMPRLGRCRGFSAADCESAVGPSAAPITVPLFTHGLTSTVGSRAPSRVYGSLFEQSAEPARSCGPPASSSSSSSPPPPPPSPYLQKQLLWSSGGGAFIGGGTWS